MGRRTLFRRAHLGLQTCSSTCENALRGGAVSRRAARACCRAATRAPEGVCAGIFVANRSSARAARRKARATAGTHSGRGRPPARPMCRGDSKRLGARGSAWPCVSEVAAAVRGRFQLKNWSRACACQGISWNCVNGFATVRKRLVQANACSGRPRRDPQPGCGADGPAQHGPPRGRSRDRALLNSTDARLPCCSGSRPCQCGARRSGVARVSVCCAPRVASGCSAGRSGRSVRRPAALRSLGARCLRFRRRARLLSRESGRACDPNPFNTLRTHVLQPARFGASRACGDAPIELGASLRACFAPARRSVGGAAGRARLPWNRGVARGSAGYLVDPASSHMLVSKIKPCMSKYKRLVL